MRYRIHLPFLMVMTATLGILMIWSSLGVAHRDGCHRWHSCPSDTGSYVCGDLGYSSGCPTSNTAKPVPQPTVPRVLRPPKVTRGVPYVHSYDLRAMGVVIAREKANWFQLGIKKLNMRIQIGSKTALLGSRRVKVKLKARPVMWQDSLYVPVSALRTFGCQVDARNLPSGVLLNCSGVRSLNIVFVKTW